MENLNEEAINYLASLEPEDRDALYRRLQERGKEKPPVESLESLTESLSELNKQPFQHREEKRRIMAEMDKKLKLEAEKQLALFISDELEKGGALNTTAIKKKAEMLGITVDIVPHIHLVKKLKRIGRGGE